MYLIPSTCSHLKMDCTFSFWSRFATLGDKENKHSIPLIIIIFYQAEVDQIAESLYSLLENLTNASHKSQGNLHKQIKEVQKYARKLKFYEWSETLTWRSNLQSNQSALSSLARQIQHGFETICLDPGFVFVGIEHISSIIEHIKSKIPVLGLSQPCRLSPLLKYYPGLVHFVLVDRRHHR